MVEGETVDLTTATTRGLLPRGGTILGSSRTNPFKSDDGVARVLDTLRRERIDALIAIGGEDTLGVAAKLGGEGAKVVGVPKTIDNDLSATEVTFGFDTAVQIATDAIDRLHTTAESHDRVMVVEVMGRHAGWIALHSGMAGGADIILIPELPFDIAEVCERIEHRHRSGASFSIVVVAEGATPAEGTMTLQSGETDEFGHVRLGGVANRVTEEIKRPHRLRRPGHDPRPRPAGRHAHRVRPGARHPLRDRGDRRGPRGRLRLDGRVAVRPDRPGPDRRRGPGAEARRPRRLRRRQHLLRLTVARRTSFGRFAAWELRSTT